MVGMKKRLTSISFCIRMYNAILREERAMGRGINFSYYLDSYEKEFIEQALIYEGKHPSVANVRQKAKEWAKQGMNEGMRQTFEVFKQENMFKVTLHHRLQDSKHIQSNLERSSSDQGER